MGASLSGPTKAGPQSREAPPAPVRPAHRNPVVGNQALLRQLQAKLTIGAVDDPLEHEADAVAEQVMRAPDPASGPVDTRLSRKCEACEAEEKVQTKREDDHDSSEEAPAAVDEALRQPGRALDDPTRVMFEAKLDTDLSGVRVHTGLAADKSAKSVNAVGYTVGQDVVFAEGRYAPGSQDGQKLLAHELAHVVQQGGGEKPKVRRWADSARSAVVQGPAGAPRADEAGELNTRLGPLQATLTAGAPGDPPEPDADAEPEVTLLSRSTDARLSRKCDTCEAEEKVQAKAAESGRVPDEAPAAVDEALRQPGQPLDRPTRAFFEARLDTDFSGVRVHTGPQAHASAKSVGALGYTVGQDLVFADGCYAPGAQEGRKLLAHELAHVVQQGGGVKPTVRRDVDPADPAKVDAGPGADAGPDNADAPSLSDIAAEGQEQTPPQTRVLRRQTQDDASPPDDPGAKPEPTRPEEIAASRSSDGLATSVTSPPTISLYNFAIDGADLKPAHKQLIAELGDLIKSAGGAAWLTIEATGNADSSGPPEVNNPLSEKRAENVKAALADASGANIAVKWRGEDDPVVSNDTADGRTRNRRVDIVFTIAPAPGGKSDGTQPDGQDPDKKKPGPDPTQDDNQDKQNKDDNKGDQDQDKDKDGDKDKDFDWFCKRHPWICLILGGGAAVTILCLLKLIPCPPGIPVIPPVPTTPPETPEPKPEENKNRERACLVDSDLPSGLLEIDPATAELLFKKDFKMKLEFQEDAFTHADPGDAICKAYCGEYRQNVKGFFQIVRANGKVENRKHHLSATSLLDPTTFKEDGEVSTGPYGHRFDDPLRTIVRANRAEDQYIPTRRDGPKYEGHDAPGLQGVRPFDTLLSPGDTYNLNLDFEGGPVDTCALAGPVAAIPSRLSTWNTWTVKGTYTKPGGGAPPPLPGGGGPGPGTSTPSTPVPAKPFKGPIGGPVTTPLLYAGGLGANPSLGPGTVRVQFTTKSGRHVSSIAVEVVEVTPNFVTIKIAGPDKMNIAPDGEPAIIFIPGRQVKLTRAALNRWP